MLYAFVDEAGDRGTGRKASPFFIMGAVTVDESTRVRLANAIADIKTQFSVPLHKPLHWADHCRSFKRRQYVARTLGALEGVQLNYVVFRKSTIPAGSGLASDHKKFYNYTAGVLLDRMLLGAKHWPGGPQQVRSFFGHVRGFNHQETVEYFGMHAQRNSIADRSLLVAAPKFVATNQNSGVQAADQYVGMLRDAITVDEYGGYEEAHLMAVRHQIRRGPNNVALNYGLKCFAEPGFPTSLPWWPRGTKRPEGPLST